MENDSNKSNVVVGPWPDSSPLVVTDSNLKKSKKTREQIIEEEMVMVDSLSENIMIQLIQSLKENSVKFKESRNSGSFFYMYNKTLH